MRPTEGAEATGRTERISCGKRDVGKENERRATMLKTLVADNLIAIRKHFGTGELLGDLAKGLPGRRPCVFRKERHVACSQFKAFDDLLRTGMLK